MRAIFLVTHLLLIAIAVASLNAHANEFTNTAKWQSISVNNTSSAYVEDVPWETNYYLRVAAKTSLQSNNTNDNESESEEEEEEKTADLALQKEVNNPTPEIGEEVTFTITVRNDGPDDADYAVKDIIPSGFSNITDINRGGRLNGNVITWRRQWIGANDEHTFIFKATVNIPACTPNEYKNIAQIKRSNRADPDSTPNNDDGDQSEDDEDNAIVNPNSTICDVESADLSLSKTVDNATPNIGETVTFSLTISNAGPDTATNVGVSDIVPVGYTNIGNVSNGGVVNGNNVSWSIASVASGASVQVSFTAEVVAPTGVANEYVNTAQISASDQSDPDSTPNNDDGDQSEDDEDNASVTPGGDLGEADLMLTKSVDNATPNIGETVTFSLTISNAGPDTATNVGVSDIVPVGYTNIGNVSNGGVVNGNNVSWSIASVASGASVQVSFTAEVVAPTGVANEYVNTAQISASDQSDPDSTPNNDDGDQSEDDEDNASVTPGGDLGEADLMLTKSVDNATPNIGETVTFSLTISNAGPDTATNVGVSDIVPVGYTNIGNVSNGGVVNGNNVSWSIASVASGASVQVSFTAEVVAPTGVANEYVNTAQISASDQSDPDSTPNNDDGDQSEDDEDNASVTPGGDLGEADLMLTKSVDNATPNIGESVTFTLTISNAGPDTATNVGVSDIVPVGYTNIGNVSNGGIVNGNNVSWSIASVASGASVQVSFTADVVAPTGVANEYVNTAQISASDQSDPDSTPNNDDGDQSEDDEDNASVTPGGDLGEADLMLTKSVDNATPNIGESVTFTLTISNAGPDTATNVGVSDIVPVGYTNIGNVSNGGVVNGNNVSWSIASVASGASVQVSFTADVVAPTGVANEYVNTAQISASDQSDPDSTPNNDDGDQSEDDEDNASVTPGGDLGEADLMLTKSVDNATPNIGESVTFTLTISNAGPDTATNVGVSDIVPVGYTNIGNVSNGGVVNGNNVSWSIASVASGASVQVSFTADVVAPTGVANEYVNTAQISASDQSDPDSTPNNDDGDQSEDDEDNASVTPGGDLGEADLMLTKSVDNATPNIGESVTFTLTISNAGPDTATNVGVSDIVPVGYTNIGNVSNGGIVNGNNVSWSIASVASGASVQVSFTADVVAPTGVANEYVNTAQISASDQSDPDSTPNNDDGDQSEDDEDNASVTPGGDLGEADLMLTKSVDNATPNIGESVTFTLTISNAGPDTATNVGVSDIVPVGYTNIGNVSNGGVVNGNNVSWSIASVASGASVQVSFTAEVVAPTGVANEYVNTAQISASDQSDPDSTPNNDDGDQSEDDEDNASVTPGGDLGEADLMLTKSVDNATPNIGESVTFTLTISNAGPDTATNVGVSDIVPVGYTNIGNVSNGGVVNGNNVSWSIASVASGASVQVSFTADVVAPTG